MLHLNTPQTDSTVEDIPPKLNGAHPCPNKCPNNQAAIGLLSHRSSICLNGCENRPAVNQNNSSVNQISS